MKNFFAANRERLIAMLSGGIIVLSGYAKMQRSNDMAFFFQQEANFWWLTGVEAADWWVIIDGTRSKAWLVSPTISTVHEVFDGSLSPEKAKKISGVDGVLSEDEAHSLLRELAKKHSMAYTLGDQPHAEHYDFYLNPAPKKMYEQLDRTFNAVRDCRKELAKLRAIKQSEEITRIKKAIHITVAAFEEVKEHLSDAAYEYQVEAQFSHYFRSHGARGHAYDPIVASGKNACTLHYVENNSKLKQHELVLLDIGAEKNGYVADITRTYALGEPTKRQRAVHVAVQTAQKRIIENIRPNMLVEEYQRQVDTIMTQALLELELMRSENDMEKFRRYFPHSISHGLGVDVHDSLGAPRILQSGMVLTVEPGIYIPEEGIGVRIEDDILVTPNGHTNLSGRLSTDL